MSSNHNANRSVNAASSPRASRGAEVIRGMGASDQVFEKISLDRRPAENLKDKLFEIYATVHHQDQQLEELFQRATGDSTHVAINEKHAPAPHNLHELADDTIRKLADNQLRINDLKTFWFG